MAQEIHVHIVVSSKLVKGVLAAGLLAALSLPLLPETLTMTTYYPAPVGVYNKMTTTGKTILARDGGSVSIGTAVPSLAAAVDIHSTTQGLLPPRMTTAQRDAIVSPVPPGLTIYNTDTNQLEFFNGAGWVGAGGAVKATLCTDAASTAGSPGAIPACMAATANGGAGDAHNRVMNCADNPGPAGVVGVQIIWGPGWEYYDVGSQLWACKPGTALVVSW